jgi:ssDNA-binding Zn-finger/Zn-ribbon topoisomerase 1
MTQGQRETTPFHCPRCGGPMRKAVGSTLYWHADNNHPRCDITNILESVLEAKTTPPTNPPPPQPPKWQRPH